MTAQNLPPGANRMERAPDLPKLKTYSKPNDFYKIAATVQPKLHEWLYEVHRNRLMNGILDICKANGLDPETATVRQFMELK